MASAARSFGFLARSAPTRASAVRGVASRQAAFAPRQTFRQGARRGYADSAPKSGGSNTGLFAVLGLAAAGGAGYYFYANGGDAVSAVKSSVGKKAGSFVPELRDYQEVYDAVAKRLVEHDNYDDGSYGPVLLRLGWHASGT